jgi:DNA ligase (NAD+)
VAQIVAAHFGSLAPIARASVEDLRRVRGVGPEIAESIAQFFVDPHNRRLCQRLATAGVVVTVTGEPTDGRGPLAGKTIALTGRLRGLTRDGAGDLIRRLGGRVSGSISRETDYLVVGDEPGSKLEDARRAGVQTLDEAALRRMVTASAPKSVRRAPLPPGSTGTRRA